MHPDSVWSSSLNKAEIKLSSAQTDWKNFMNECLMGTEIFKKNENENEKCLCEDPNVVMDVRHRLVKESARIIPVPQELIHAEALKLLRIENHSRLLKQKEGRMVEKEIAKLKQTLENHRLFTKKKIDETTNKRIRPSSTMPKFPKHTKLWKELDCNNEAHEVNTWQCRPVSVIKSKISQNAISCVYKSSLKEEEHLDEISEPVSIQKGSIIENESEGKKFWEENEGKNEIMKRFFEKETVEIKEDLQHDVKEPEKMSKSSENLENQKRMEQIWEAWKAYTQKLKGKRREKTIYKNKIEAFLVKLKEKEIREEKAKRLKGIMNFKADFKVNLTLKNETKQQEKLVNFKEKEERLEKLMIEVKTSQMEACQKLKDITRNGLGNQEKTANVEFLKRMEERRTERLKRRREIEEKRRQIEEEKEKIQKEREEEKKRQEEEYKRKSLQEFREKRRLELERKEEQKREREKLKLKIRLAENHYKKYLVRSHGLRPWKAFMRLRESQNEEALVFFERRLKQKALHLWMANAREQIVRRVTRADALYEKVLKKKCLSRWIQFYKDKLKLEQVAVDWNELKIVERTFKRWLDFTQDEQLEYLDKLKIAELSYERRLKMKCLKKIKYYPEFKKLEIAKEYRKRKWREKVKQILPDYQPVDEISSAY